MMKFKITILIISIFVFVQCNKNSISKVGDNSYKTDFINTYKVENIINNRLDLNNLILAINELKLTNVPKDVVIGKVHKILITDTHIFLLDKKHNQAVFIFNIDGGFISTLYQRGQGSGEYLRVSDFQVDISHKEIILLDADSRRLLFYDLNNLSFIRSLSFDFFINSFGILNDSLIVLDRGNYISDGTNDYLALVSRIENKVIKTILPRDRAYESFTMNPINSFFKKDEYLLFLPSVSNKMYRINNDMNVMIDCYFDFGFSWISENFVKKNQQEHPSDIVKKMLSENYVLFLNVLESNTHYALNYYIGENKIVTFLDKESKKEISLIWEREDFQVMEPPITTFNDEFVSIKYHEEDDPSLIFFSLNKID